MYEKLDQIEVVFVDWAPIRKKSEIQTGGQIRRYYAFTTLCKMCNKVIPFRKENGQINWHAVYNMLKKNTVIWVEYGCGRKSHIFVLLASVFRSKKIIINSHDLVIQQKYVDKEAPFIKRIQLEVIEKLLFQRAETIILPWPGLLFFLKIKKKVKLIIMPPGVGKDELTQNYSKPRKKKIALYFGSMKRKGGIPKIVELFFDLPEWDLHLVGLKEGEEIVETKNVKYLGAVSHDKIHDVQSNADVILIPLPKNQYLDLSMHMKIGYALKSCKPIIATKLNGISEYVSMLGLEENMVYINEWTLDSLKESLHKVQELNIDCDKTIDNLRLMAWEPRFEKVVEITLGDSARYDNSIVWV